MLLSVSAIIFYVARTSNNKQAFSDQIDLVGVNNSVNANSSSFEQKNYLPEVNNNQNSDTEVPVKNPEEEKLAIDQKKAALKVVEEELRKSPSNELLKDRRDVLLNDWLADPSQDTPRQ